MTGFDIDNGFTNEERELFLRSLGHLLTYANAELGVVDLDEIAMFSDDRRVLDAGALVCGRLWRETSVIDDYLSENPFDVDEEELGVVRQWRYAVRGLFTVVAARPGGIVAMNGDSLFRVESVVGRIDTHIKATPTQCVLTLLPFMGRTVTDTVFFRVSGDEDVSRAVLYDRYESLLVAGALVSDESSLCSYAAAARPSNRLDDDLEHDIESLLSRSRR